MARIIAVSGYKDSGKTTLCARLLSELARLGVRTGYIKRTAEGPVYSGEKVDTAAARELGVDSLLWADDGLVLESSLSPRASVETIVSRYFPDAELVILEGGKDLDLPKIWVCSEKDEAVINYPGIFIRYDRRVAVDSEGVFGAGSEARITALLKALVRGEAYRSCKVYIGDKLLPMKDFVADFVRGGAIGMITSLKGAGSIDSDVRIYIKKDPGKSGRRQS